MAIGSRQTAADRDAEDEEEYEDGEDEYDDDDDDDYDEDEDEDEEYDEDEDEDEQPAEVVAPPARGAPAPAGRGRPAPVRAARTPPPARPPADENDPVAVSVEILQRMLDLLEIEATITPRPPETVGDGSADAILDVEGPDLGILIGRRGETLTAMQYLVNLMLNRRVKNRASVGIDVEGYRRRREESLHSLANRMAARVVSSGTSITLEPMPPNERRIVHLALADHPDVVTVSIGEGEARKVAITPRG